MQGFIYQEDVTNSAAESITNTKFRIKYKSWGVNCKLLF